MSDLICSLLLTLNSAAKAPGETLRLFRRGVSTFGLQGENDMILTRCARIDHIEGLSDSEKDRPFKLCFRDGTFAIVENRETIKKLSSFFGCEGGKGGLQEKLYRHLIVYCMTFDKRRLLRGFTPYDQWDGPEMNEGDFLIDRCTCNVWDYREPSF